MRLGRLPGRGFESRRVRKSLTVVGHRRKGPFPSESCLLVVKIRYTSAKTIESDRCEGRVKEGIHIECFGLLGRPVHTHMRMCY